MDEPRIGPYYLHQSYTDIAALLGPAAHTVSAPQPAPRQARGPRVCLPQSLPLRLGPVAAAFSCTSAPTTVLDTTLLAQLLFYSYGFSRHDVGLDVEWPFHRMVPSARCLFPTELYLWLPATPERPAGIYQYDALHHQLITIRPGDYRAFLEACLDIPLTDAVAVVLISSVFGRTAARYASFAYRLCTQEAGIVAGNLLLVAQSLGLDAQVCSAFLDAPLNRLIGASAPDEAVMTVIPLVAAGCAPMARLGALCCADALPDALAPLPARPSVTLDRLRCQMLLTMDAQAAITSTADFRPLPPTRIGDGEPALAAPAASYPTADLADALHRRSSGDRYFSPEPRTLSAGAFWNMLHAASSPYHHDLTADGRAPLTEVRVVVARVDGIPAGVYHWSPGEQRLLAVNAGPVSDALRDVQPMMRNDRAAFVAYIIGDFRPLPPDGYERAYRAMHIESGLVSQRISIVAAAYECAARCSDSYRLPLAHRLLKLPDPLVLPLVQIAVGHEAAGVGAAARYRLSLRF